MVITESNTQRPNRPQLKNYKNGGTLVLQKCPHHEDFFIKKIITGITGFVGSHMTDYLLDNVKDVQIYATRRWRSKEDNIKHLFGDDRVIFEECDLLDRGSLSRIIEISHQIWFIILRLKVFLNQVFSLQIQP